MPFAQQHPIVQDAVLFFYDRMITKGILPDPWQDLTSTDTTEGEKIEQLARSVCNSLSRSRFSAGRFSAQEDGLRCSRARGMGLVPIAASATDQGSFAEVLATHPAMPDVLVKVVPEVDQFVKWARYLIATGNTLDCFPDIYNVACVDGHAVVLCERIPGDILTEDEWCDEDGWYGSEGARFVENYCRFHTFAARTDYHNENFMRREDGTLVCIDPVY